MRRRRRIVQDAAWHEARMAEGPQGFLRDNVGIKTWDELHERAAYMTDNWEHMPKSAREEYAYPNPEDRRIK